MAGKEKEAELSDVKLDDKKKDDKKKDDKKKDDKKKEDKKPDKSKEGNKDKGKNDKGTAEEESEEATSCCAYPTGQTFEDFRDYDDRGCTNILCCILFVVMVGGWIALFVAGVIFGKPETIYRATDSMGNTCGKEVGSFDGVLNTPEDGRLWPATKDGKDEKQEVKDARFEAHKFGVFPRLVDDVLSQAEEIADGNTIKLTTVCTLECPKKGDVVCSYDFLQKYSTDNPVTKVQLEAAGEKDILKFKRYTSQYSRSLVLANDNFNTLIEATCRAETSSKEERELCINAFFECDINPTATFSLLGRCVPYVLQLPQNITERCVEPLSNADCDAEPLSLARENKFTKDCVAERDSDGNIIGYKKPEYNPTLVEDLPHNQIHWKLSGEAEEACVRKEVYTETLSEQIPQGAVIEALSKGASVISKYIQDIRTAGLVVAVCGIIVATLLGFVWVFILRWLTGCMVWMTILMFEVIFLCASMFFLFKGGVISGNSVFDNAAATLQAELGEASGETFSFYDGTNEPSDYSTYYQVAGWVFLAAVIIVLCIIIFAFKAIRSAIAIVKTGAMAINSQPTIVLMPLISLAGIAATGVFFIIVGVLLSSAGQFSTEKLGNGTLADSFDQLANATGPNPFLVQTFKRDSLLEYLLIGDLFMFLWVSEFIQAISILSIAGAVTHWYWGSKDIGADVTAKPKKYRGGVSICCSWKLSMRFHGGTAAFGSLIIAIVQLIRMILAYMQKQLKAHAGDSKLIVCALKILQCCFCCFEQCMKFVSKQAYIYTAITGNGFCFSCWASFKLIFNHLLRFGTSTTITNILMLIGKLFIMCFSTFVGYVWLTYSETYSERSDKNYISSPIFCCIVILLISFMIAEGFLNVFHVAIDSVLLSYCMDLDKHPDGKGMHGRIHDDVGGLGKQHGKPEMEDLKESARPKLIKEDGCCNRCC
eukprot:g220.t1